VHCLNGIADQFWDQTVNGIRNGSIYAMIALGYTLVYGVLQLINFAHSEVFMVGTVVTLYAFRNWFGVTGPESGFFLALLILGAILPAMLASGVTAITLERVAYRPLRKRGAPRLSFLISAIGASLAIQYLFALMDGRHYLLFFKLPALLGPDQQPIPEVMKTRALFNLFGTPVSNKDVMIVVVALLMLFFLDRFVRLTRTGRAIRAVAQDAETASLMGVNIDRVVSTTFFVGGVLAGAAGLLYVMFLGSTSFLIGFEPGIKAFTAAVLGGIGNIRGAMAGGLVLGLVEGYGVACTAAQWQIVIVFLVLVGVLMFRPTGILGERVGG
jgi:branched-chain amino acid transport system permease protein